MLNLTIMSYIIFPPVLQSSKLFLSAPFDMGLDRLRNHYHLNSSLCFVGSPTINTTSGMIDDLYKISKCYHTQWDRNGLFVLICPGTQLACLIIEHKYCKVTMQQLLMSVL